MWACHLGLQAIVMPTPRLGSINYARILKQLSSRIVGQQQIWIRVPLMLPLDYHDVSQFQTDSCDGWYAWDSVRCSIEQNYFKCEI
jgi:hypothetical protein